MKTVVTHLPWLADRLAAIDAGGLRRPRREVRSLGDGLIEIEGRTLADFSSNDYLGLSSHPAVIAAARAALDEDRFGSGASALVTGRTAYHAELERTLAAFEGEEDAILFPTGYAANAGTIAALVGHDDVVFCDRLNHSCLVDGCRLSGAAFRVYRSDRLEQLERHLAATTGHVRRWIVTDGVFGMDGTLAPLADLCDLAERHDASLIVDEAHGTGVLGERGRGACEAAGVTSRVAVRTGTLSKAIGALGGFVAAPRELTEYLWHHAKTQMFSTALPAVVCAAATAAVRVIEGEPARRVYLAAMSDRLRSRLQSVGLSSVDLFAAVPESNPPLLWGEGKGVRGRPAAIISSSNSNDDANPAASENRRQPLPLTPGPSPQGEGGSAKVARDDHPNAIPIVPVILGEPQRAVGIGAELERRGFAVGVIRPPTVPRGTARLRVSLSAAHNLETVDRLADALIEVCQT